MKSLFVDGFRGIDASTLDFSSPTTVLVGSNASGKTALIECAYLLLRETRRNQGIRDSGFDVADVSNDRPRAHCRLAVRTDAVDVDFELELERLGEDVDGPLTTKLASSWSGRSDPDPELPPVIYYDVDRARNEDFRRGPSQRRHPAPPLRPSHGAMGRGNFRLFTDWFQQQEDIENQLLRDRPNHRDPVLEAVRRAVRTAAGHGLLGDVGELRIERRRPVRMVLRKGEEELVVDQLSHGEKSLLSMIADIAFRLAVRNPDVADPLAAPAWVFIDEIELHLHPRWQRAVVPALEHTFPGCQFVVSTHSPQTLSEVPAESVRILERRGRHVDIAVPRAAYGLDSNRILEDVMGALSRPPEIERDLEAVFDDIQKGELDKARTRLAELKRSIGDSDPALTRAEALIHRRETLGR